MYFFLEKGDVDVLRSFFSNIRDGSVISVDGRFFFYIKINDHVYRCSWLKKLARSNTKNNRKIFIKKNRKYQDSSFMFPDGNAG